jgi:hypothetical protein
MLFQTHVRHRLRMTSGQRSFRSILASGSAKMPACVSLKSSRSPTVAIFIVSTTTLSRAAHKVVFNLDLNHASALIFLVVHLRDKIAYGVQAT